MGGNDKRLRGITLQDPDLVLQTVAAIGRRMDSVEEIVGTLADADDRLRAKMLAKFGKSRRCAQVYLALDGMRTVSDVSRKLGIQRQNVDVEIRKLWKKRVIDIAESTEQGVIYRKRSIDRFTGLSDDLMEMFGLDRSGRLLK